MKRKDIIALHQKTVAELETELEKLLNELTKARMEKTAGKLSNVALVHTLADDVARVRAIIKEKLVWESWLAK